MIYNYLVTLFSVIPCESILFNVRGHAYDCCNHKRLFESEKRDLIKVHIPRYPVVIIIGDHILGYVLKMMDFAMT